MRPERVLAVVFAISALFVQPPVVRASSGRRPTIAETYERATFVCVADVLEVIRAAEPSAAAPETRGFHRVRFTHVWKGDPPDTLRLPTSGSRIYDPDSELHAFRLTTGEPRNMEVGKQYLMFMAIWEDGYIYTLDRSELSESSAGLLWLERNVGPPLWIAPDAETLPADSFRKLARELEHGDSLAIGRAALALSELSDSSGVVVAGLDRIVQSTTDRWRREQALYVLGRWTREDRKARVALLRALDRGDTETRLVLLSRWYFAADEELQNRIFEHREDPSPEVRVAALTRAAELVTSAHPPIRGFTDALRDRSPLVRGAAIRALRGATTRIDEISSALAPLLEDPDIEVAAAARSAMDALANRKR